MKRLSTTTPEPRTTLVHYDPYFMGGFRNQHMRFVALVAFAVKHNMSQILLPSLRWMDAYNKPQSIHHELLFDVPYWNARAEKMGLPRLVHYDAHVLEGVVAAPNNKGIGNKAKAIQTIIPCWNATSSLYSGLDEAMLRSPRTPIRRIDIWNMMGQVGETYSHCRRTTDDNGGENKPSKIIQMAMTKHNTTTPDSTTASSSSPAVHRFTHLMPHGGLMQSGRLWWEYNALQAGRGKATQTALLDDGKVVQIHPEHVPVEQKVYKLLRPSRHIRKAADDAIRNAMHDTIVRSQQQQQNQQSSKPRLLALHPRVEPEMFEHQCGIYLEKNLTTVFARLRTYPSLRSTNTTNNYDGLYRFDLVFIAVSREQMTKMVRKAHRKRDFEFVTLTRQNLDVLNHVRENGLFHENKSRGKNDNNHRGIIPLFELGRESAVWVQFPKQRSLDDRSSDKSNRAAKTTPSSSNSSSYDTPQSLGVTELVASIINFFIIIDADIFVGVKGSTYSTDAFSVRYYQQKEDEEVEYGLLSSRAENYILGPDGITRLYGPAAPHPCV